MRAVIQRVSRASVQVEGAIKASVGRGLLVLLGIADGDSDRDISWLSRKIVNLRVFNDADGLMNRSVKDEEGAILLVSQFTLYADARKGNRPSFTAAARPEAAQVLYEQMIRQLTEDLGKAPATGIFGADMQIDLVNDGPVTILLDSATGS